MKYIRCFSIWVFWNKFSKTWDVHSRTKNEGIIRDALTEEVAGTWCNYGGCYSSFIVLVHLVIMRV